MPDTLRRITDDLVTNVEALRFAAPVTHVYNPLVYARAPYDEYLRRYARGSPDVLLIGMNPGPFGMTQTGVPFGEVAAVRDWMKIDAAVKRPAREHPARPIEGFACKRSEVSGARLWGFARDVFGSPDAFFARFFVLNYCPLVFLEDGGKNRTPDKLPAREREPLEAACDEALRRSAAVLKPRLVVGIGGFAQARAQAALGIEAGSILHPSPANPQANKDWAGTVKRQLGELGVKLPR